MIGNLCCIDNIDGAVKRDGMYCCPVCGEDVGPLLKLWDLLDLVVDKGVDNG